jgi:hypothetical protein
VTRFHKVAASLFIVGFLALSAIDALPVVVVGQARLKAGVHAFLVASGLWQGNWQLFAPEPRNLNIWISARFVGTQPPLEWRSPEWRTLSLVEKFFLVRHMKFYDAVRLDVNREAWPSFADYYLRQLPPADRQHVVRVELRREWRETPDPRVEWIPAGTAIVPDHSFLFFAKDVP